MKPSKEKKDHRQVSGIVVNPFLPLSTLHQYCSFQFFVTKMVPGRDVSRHRKCRTQNKLEEIPNASIAPHLSFGNYLLFRTKCLEVVSIGNGPWPILISRLEPWTCSGWVSGNMNLRSTKMLVLFSWQIMQKKASVDLS